MPLRPGLVGEATMVVTESDTAVAFGSGGVEVLATPRLISLCERASFLAVEELVPPGHTTVGSGVQFSHVHPTKVGAAVRAEATLEKVEGRRLSFTVSATDDDGLVGAGKVTRVVVEKERFMSRAGATSAS